MIPQGWQEKTLNDLCYIEIGKTPSRSNIKYWDKKKATTNIWLSIADLNNDINKNVYDSNEYLSDAGADVVKLVKKGTLLLSFKLTLGRVAFAGKDLRTNEAIAQLPIKNDNDINKFYLYYYLKFFDYELLLKGDVKVKGKTLNKEKLKLLPVYYPQLPEQERIVAKLDKVFEAIDKVKANAEQNLNNAKEIYNIQKELIFKTVLENKPVEFGDIIELLTDYHANGSYKLLKEHVELLDNENYAWMIRSTDFENEFKNNFKYINEKAYNFLEKTKIFGNEIIMSKIGNAGKIYLMPVVNRPVSLAMNLFLIRVKEKLAISSYVYRFLLTNIGQKQINERCKGAATQTITKDNVRSIKIYLPNTLSEQQKIVEQLDKIQEKTKKLEAIYTQKIKECDELKQSILQKAFRGEL